MEPAQPPGPPEPPGSDLAGGAPGDPTGVPDDARELARDTEAWRRERRWRRPRRMAERLLPPGRRRGRNVAVAAVAACLAAIGMIATMIAAFSTRSPTHPVPAVALPLASTTAAPASVGGLLPAATLQTPDGAVDARLLRPGVVALLPAGCHCATALRQLERTASVEGLTVFLVGTAGQRATLDDLARQAGTADVKPVVDTEGRLGTAFGPADPTGLTVVPVHADGVVAAVVRGYAERTLLGPVLATLRQPGA